MAESPETTRSRRALTRIGSTLTVAILIGVLLRLTLRDGSAYLAPLYYALPLPVLAALAALRTGCLLVLARRRLLLLWVPVTLALVAWCCAANYQRHMPQHAPGSLRIFCWNVGHDEGDDLKYIADAINRERPHIAGIIEAAGLPEEVMPFFAQACPDYRLVMFGKGMMCLSRGEFDRDTLTPLADGGYLGEVPVRFADSEVRVLLVDIKSDPFRNRAGPLAALARHAEQAGDRPIVIMGDFNTPSDSVHLRPLRRQHREAFDTAGRGYQPTWPIPVPVLHLDQIWTNRHLRTLNCEHRWTIGSDHRPVVADVLFAAGE